MPSSYVQPNVMPRPQQNLPQNPPRMRHQFSAQSFQNQNFSQHQMHISPLSQNVLGNNNQQLDPSSGVMQRTVAPFPGQHAQPVRMNQPFSPQRPPANFANLSTSQSQQLPNNMMPSNNYRNPLSSNSQQLQHHTSLNGGFQNQAHLNRPFSNQSLPNQAFRQQQPANAQIRSQSALHPQVGNQAPQVNPQVANNMQPNYQQSNQRLTNPQFVNQQQQQQ